MQIFKGLLIGNMQSEDTLCECLIGKLKPELAKKKCFKETPTHDSVYARPAL